MRRALSHSLLLHGLFVSVVILSPLTPSLQGNPKDVTAYLFHPPLQIQSADQSASAAHSSDLSISPSLSHNRPHDSKRHRTNTLAAQPIEKPIRRLMPVKKSQDTPSAEIRKVLQYLHDLIAKVQSYPKSALINHESGTVKLGFWLMTDGTLKKITIIDSSGFASIDQAAVRTLHEIRLTQKGLIEESEYLTIDIIF